MTKTKRLLQIHDHVWTLRLQRHHAHPCEPITEIHCWIATYADGHEEIVLHVPGIKGAAPSQGRVPGYKPWPIGDKEAEVMEALQKRGPAPVTLRLASFHAVEP